MQRVRLLDSPERMPLEGLLTIPSLVGLRRGKTASPYSDGLRSLIGCLPDGIVLSIAASESTITVVERWPEFAGRRGRSRFIPVSDDVDFSFWCQDEFMAGLHSGDDRPILIRSAVAKRDEDAAVAEAVGRATGIEVVRSDIAFEGGNVLAGDDFVLVGGDARPGFAERPGLDGRRVLFVETRSEVPRRRVRLVQTGDRPMVEEIHAGTGRRQPVFHLDAFLTLAGRGADGRYRVLLGDPRLAVELTGDGRLAPAAEALAPAFDEVADWFAVRREFAVIRNPLPIIFSHDSGLLSWSPHSIAREFAGVDGVDDVLSAMTRRGLKRVAVRRWYFATQNGAITLEDVDGERMVLLPTYAKGAWRCLAPAERRNAEVWGEFGFRVVELSDFHAFARRHGSAHCVFKVLARR